MVNSNNELAYTALPASEIIISKTSRLWSAYALVIFSCLLLYIQMLAPYFLPAHFGAFTLQKTTHFIYFIAFNLFWCVAIPITANKLVLKDNLAFLRMPKNKMTAILLTCLALLLLVPFMYYFSKQADFRTYYYLGHNSVAKIVLIDFLLMPLYYFSEEFFFRGYLFLGLWRRVGWHSFWITDIIFTIAHMNKPGLEILLAIPASVIFNLLTLKTKSIYPAVIVHTTMGIVLNLAVMFAHS